MEVNVKNIQGKVVKKITLPDSIFDVPMNDHLLHNVVKAYQANKRQGTHSTKTKGRVSGGGKKPYRQKGTGNARQGSMRNPHMEGGGVAHGPLPRDYRLAINKKMKDRALRVALSDRARHEKLVVVDDFAISSYSTKQMISTLKALDTQSAVFTDERKDDYLHKSIRNIYRCSAVSATELNAFNVLKHENLVICEKALETLQQRLKEK